MSVRIAFDIGGMLSKYPASSRPQRRELIETYCSDEWKTSGKEGEFGRRKRVDAYLNEGQS